MKYLVKIIQLATQLTEIDPRSILVELDKTYPRQICIEVAQDSTLNNDIRGTFMGLYTSLHIMSGIKVLRSFGRKQSIMSVTANKAKVKEVKKETVNSVLISDDGVNLFELILEVLGTNVYGNSGFVISSFRALQLLIKNDILNNDQIVRLKKELEEIVYNYKDHKFADEEDISTTINKIMYIKEVEQNNILVRNLTTVIYKISMEEWFFYLLDLLIILNRRLIEIEYDNLINDPALVKPLKTGALIKSFENRDQLSLTRFLAMNGAQLFQRGADVFDNEEKILGICLSILRSDTKDISIKLIELSNLMFTPRYEFLALYRDTLLVEKKDEIIQFEKIQSFEAITKKNTQNLELYYKENNLKSIQST